MKTWVVGCGGLLGSALTEHFIESGVKPFRPTKAFSWNDTEKLAREFAETAREFGKATDDAWTVCYAAGRGIMTSRPEDLAKETKTLSMLLRALSDEPLLRNKPATFMFASSAGAIYGESTDETITEASAPKTRSAYGKEKLEQEKLVTDWAKARPNTSVLIARLSTLYGPAQARGKRQGLISHIARSALARKPIEIFVPLDTMRDYLHVRDAAGDIVRTLSELTENVTMKIIASEEPTTVAEIIGLFRKILKTPPKISTATRTETARYPHRMKFRSTVMPHANKKRTSLLLGVSEVLAAEKLAIARGTRTI